MNKRSGFGLIELVLSVGLLSLILTIFLKLKASEHSRSQAILEEQNLTAYVDVLEWTLHQEKNTVGFWSGFQDIKSKERKFVHGDKKEKECLAEVNEDDDTYRIILRGTTSKNKKIKPIAFFIPKKTQN